MADKQNVVSVSDRIPALKEQRKKRANRRLIFLFKYLLYPYWDRRLLSISSKSCAANSS